MYRQLGTNERIFWSYDQVRPMHFTLTANIIGTLHVDQLQQALFLAQQRHPLLNVRIVLDQSGIPWLMSDSAKIPVRLVKRHSEQQWQQEVEQELANPFDWNQAPLIRVVLLQGKDVSDLIITCHHAIADGMSVVFLLRDILEAVGLPDLQLSVLPEKPNYEQLVLQFQQKLQALSFEPSLATTKTKPTLPEKSRPRLHTWSLSSAETISLVHRCQQAQTSVHAVICAAFVLAIARSALPEAIAGQRTQKNDLEKSTTLKCLSPINVRRFLPGIEEDFGFYFTAIVTTDTITPDLSLWELAHSIKAQLNQKMAPEQIFAHLPNSEAFVSTLPSTDEVVDMMETVNGYDVLVTNLGRLTIPQQYGEFQLVAVYGPSGTTHIDRDRMVGVMTLGDQMFFSLVYSELEISPAQIEQLQQKAMQFLGVTKEQYMG
ncbi:MAG: condensation domain-containing protein [Brasilonema sp.]